MSSDHSIDSYFKDTVIVKRKAGAFTVPLFCPVCDFAMTKPDDSQFYKTYQACSECSLEWAEPNREKWKNGWRPSKKQKLPK